MAAGRMSRPGRLHVVAAIAAVFGLVVLPGFTAIFDIEEGGLADVLWMTQMVSLVGGVVAAVVGLRRLRSRRAES